VGGGAILSVRKYVIAGVITLAAIIGFAVLAPRQQSQDWIRCVNKEKASPDLQIGGCTTVIQSDKESKNNLAIAFTNRGVAYRNKGQYARAIQDYDQAIKLDPNYAIAFRNRGIAYDEKGQYDRAIRDYD